MRELEVSGVVSGQSKAFRQARGRGPCLARGLIIEADGQSVQKSSQRLSPRCVETTAALGVQKPVQRFERPKNRRQGACPPTRSSKAVVAGVRSSSKHRVSATELSRTKLTIVLR